ncbi:MAG: hypothetical protein IVW36_00755 [Dehalococcoidia bacterium]|nr:hypothetical protein [Dehalococcoidia bacterium]
MAYGAFRGYGAGLGGLFRAWKDRLRKPQQETELPGSNESAEDEQAAIAEEREKRLRDEVNGEDD